MNTFKIIVLLLIIFILYKIVQSNNENKIMDNMVNINKIKNNRITKFKTYDDFLKKKNKSCISCSTDTDADTYLRTRLVERKDECRINPTYNDYELKNYRDKHFAFRNKIFQTSKDVDMVDKLNYLEQVGSYDVSRNKKGQRISDMYDYLTRSDDLIMPQMHKDYKSEKPIQRIMDQTGIPVEGHNGDMWSNQNWGYNNEKDFNGGNFYNNITGYDGQFNPPQSVPK